MSVGIMDADLAKYIMVPWNLECMKLSAYYKRHNQLVIFSPFFVPDRHQKFIYRKDYEDGDYPINLLGIPNVEYGGLAFSNNKYKPLPLDIEKMKPDTSLYHKMESHFKLNKTQQTIWQNMMTAEHIRLSLDDSTIWPDYWRQLKSIRTARQLMIHDYDLGAINGSFEEVKRILAKARTDGWATRLGMKFPVQCNDGQALLDWSSFKSNGIFYSIKYNGVIDDDAFNEWVGICRERAIFSSIDYHVTLPSYDENHFIQDLLPKILKQVIISRSYRIFFSLNYDKGYFTDPRWEKVLQLFNYYHNSLSGIHSANYLQKIPDDTLFDFAAGCTDDLPRYYQGKAFTQSEIREIFAFVRYYHYELFKDFYECTAAKLGGKL